MNNKIMIYACMLEGSESKTLYYWKNPADYHLNIGDYVLVENLQSYALAKIVGIVTCEKKDVFRFANRNYNEIKNIISRIEIEYYIDKFDVWGGNRELYEYKSKRSSNVGM